MKRRRIILFGALLVLAAGVIALWPRGPKEPVYQGRKLGEWIEEGRYAGDSNKMEAARLTIRTIGTNALPYLISEYTKPKRKLAATLNKWASRVNWDLKLDEGRGKKQQAALGLYFLGPAAIPVLPILAERLAEQEDRSQAAWLMSSCGEAAIPYLTNALASTNSIVSSRAVDGLSSLAEKTDSAIPHLVQVLSHPDIFMRFAAAESLANLKASPGIVVPFLIEGLTNRQESWVPIRAVQSLCDYGTAAKSAVPELLVLFKGADTDTSLAASNALFRIDPSALPK